MVSNSINYNYTPASQVDLNSPTGSSGFNSGFAPSDAQGARNIQRSVDPSSLGLRPVGFGDNIFTTTSQGDSIFDYTTNFSQGLYPIGSGNTPRFGIARGSVYPIPVPTFDTQAFATDIFGGTNYFTQFVKPIGGVDLNGQLIYGGDAIPGMPVYTQQMFGGDAVNALGQTFTAIGALAPYHPTLRADGITFNSQDGLSVYYPPQPIQTPVAGLPDPNSYSSFQPYGKVDYPYQISGVVNTYPAGGVSGASASNGTVASSSNSFLLNPGFNHGPYVGGQSQSSRLPDIRTQSGLDQLAFLIRRNQFRLPQVIPFNGTVQGLNQFILQFNSGGEAYRSTTRNTLSNPSTVNQSDLDKSGIFSKPPAKYGLGRAISPFDNPQFIRDTDPYSRFGTGVVNTGVDGTGKFRGTPASDLVIATPLRKNVIDGRGGSDVIYGSDQDDLIQAYDGDSIFTNGGNDIVFKDVSKVYLEDRPTRIDGGSGTDILVLRTDDDPTKGDGVPLFRKTADGLISVVVRGIELFTRNIERFIVTDKDGNIGAIYDSSTFTLNDPQLGNR